MHLESLTLNEMLPNGQVSKEDGHRMSLDDFVADISLTISLVSYGAELEESPNV